MKRLFSLLVIALIAVAANAEPATYSRSMKQIWSSLKNPTNYPNVNQTYSMFGGSIDMNISGTEENLIYYYNDANNNGQNWLSFGQSCTMTFAPHASLNLINIEVMTITGTWETPFTKDANTGIWSYTNNTTTPLGMVTLKFTYEIIGEVKSLVFDTKDWFPDVAQGSREDVDTAKTYSMNGYFNVKYSAKGSLPYFSNFCSNSTDGGAAQFVDLVTDATITITPVKGVTFVTCSSYQPAYYHTGWSSWSTFGAFIPGTESWTYTNTSMSYKPFGQIRVYYTGEPEQQVIPDQPTTTTIQIIVCDMFPGVTTSQAIPAGTYPINDQFSVRITGDGATYNGATGNLEIAKGTTVDIICATDIQLTKAEYYHPSWEMWNDMDLAQDGESATLTNTSNSTRLISKLRLSYETKTTAINSIAADNNNMVEYYDMQGRRVAQPQHGIFIQRAGNNATKIIL